MGRSEEVGGTLGEQLYTDY